MISYIIVYLSYLNSMVSREIPEYRVSKWYCPGVSRRAICCKTRNPISEASGEEHPFVEWPEESRELNTHISTKKTITLDSVFYKQNDGP